MNGVRQALYTKLSTTSAITGLLSSASAIYHQRAPANAHAPFIIFQKSSGTPDRSYGASANRIDKDVWIVKAVCTGGSATAAEAIDAQIDAALDRQPLTVSARTTLIVERQSDIDYPEGQGDQTYHHVGGLYGVWTQP